MKKVFYLAAMVICAIGSVVFGDKVQKLEVEEEVNKRLSGDTDKEKGGD